jgi:1-acyl-sn-glycerol-3-phosphate acyltransferase
MPLRTLKTAAEIADLPLAERATRVLEGLAVYHNHRAIGVDRLPKSGCLIVANHSLATYDLGLLGLRILQHTGRVPRCLGDRSIFQTPGISTLADAIGIVEGSQEAAESLLHDGEIVIVAPGGMREALRPSSQAYELSWMGRKGFVKLASATQVPIVLAACPKADNIFTVYDNPVTRAVYDRFRLPMPLIRGFGLTAIPRPIRLTHWLSKPIPAPSAEQSMDESFLDHFYQQLVNQMTTMLQQGAAKLL